MREMGYPSPESFELIARRDPDGNCWFVKFRHSGDDLWLLWFGYRSDRLGDLLGGNRPWPSIFFSQHTSDPTAVHPYEPRFESDGPRPSEMSFVPGRANPIVVRSNYDVQEMRTDEAAAVVVKALCR